MVNMHQLMESDIRFSVTVLKLQPWCNFMLKSAATWRVLMQHLPAVLMCFCEELSIQNTWLLGKTDRVLLKITTDSFQFWFPGRTNFWAVPLPTGRGVWGVANFLFCDLEVAHFGEFWGVKSKVFLYHELPLWGSGRFCNKFWIFEQSNE